MVIHLDDKDREKIERIITEKNTQALLSGGQTCDATKIDSRLTYLGKEVCIIQIEIKKIREDLNKLLERDILRALERLKQDTE